MLERVEAVRSSNCHEAGSLSTSDHTLILASVDESSSDPDPPPLVSLYLTQYHVSAAAVNPIDPIPNDPTVSEALSLLKT